MQSEPPPGLPGLSAPNKNTPPQDAPKYWGRSRNDSLKSDLIKDTSVVWNGSASAAVIPREPASIRELATIEQVVQASAFAGKRVRFSGHVRTQGVTAGFGALWFRAEDAGGAVLAFQNTEHRTFGPAGPWPEHVTVIDVPSGATVLLYGGVLAGPGSLWLDDLHLAIVDRTVPLTAEPYPIGTRTNRPPDPSLVLPAPANLDFEE